MFSELLTLLRSHGAEFRGLKDAVHHLKKRIEDMDKDLQAKLDKLTADVAALASAEHAAVALLNGLSEQLKAAIAAASGAGATPEQLAAFDALDAGITASTADLAAAVTANTAATTPSAAGAV